MNVAAVMVYITTGSPEEAEKIGALLVQKRLAACANIVEGMKSIYWWQGKIDRAQETILIVKTRESLIDQLTEAVLAAHSYDCPCVVALPILGGNPEFIRWIHDETT
jgi:periplasmic divalent cation tolerance protein